MANPEFDATTRHAIYIERYKAAQVKRILSAVEGVSDDLYRLIVDQADNLTRRQIDRLLARINRVVNTGYAPITADIEKTLNEFGIYEAGWQSKTMGPIIGVDLGVPSDADIWAAVTSRPFEGKLLSEWLSALSANTARRVRETVRQGYVDGLGPVEIARQIRGTRARPGIMATSKRGSEAMVRTAISHTAARAQERTYAKNKAIIGVQHVSVLDSRTSDICRALSGRIFKMGSSDEVRYRLPLHVGERSTRAPVTNGNLQRLKDTPTYQDWLSRQSGKVQDDILGPTRGKLFRDGGLTVDKFVDESGQTYTLDQLRAKDSEAFEEAISPRGESISESLRRLGRETGHEHFAITSGDVVVKRGTSGHARHIALTPEEVKVLSDPDAPVTFHHNHPANAVSFSPADIRAMSGLGGIREMTAIAYEADFSAQRTAKTGRITKAIIARAESDADKVLARAYNSGANISEMLELKAHAMSLVLHKRGYIGYSYALPDRLKSASDAIKGAL